MSKTKGGIDNGAGWESHDRSRCIPDKGCEEITTPPTREEQAEIRALKAAALARPQT